MKSSISYGGFTLDFEVQDIEELKRELPVLTEVFKASITKGTIQPKSPVWETSSSGSYRVAYASNGTLTDSSNN